MNFLASRRRPAAAAAVATTAATAAYVGFDVDLTLGFFEYTNYLAFFWSPEYYETITEDAGRRAASVSPRLKDKLRDARRLFAELLLNDPPLLFTVLRANIGAMMEPLLRLRTAKKLKAAVLYSNTGVTYSLELATQLLEGLFRVPGFIGAAADIYHPYRQDPPDFIYGEPEPRKTFETLVRLFQKAAKKATPIKPKQVLFLDDRYVKHSLAAEEAAGLAYVMPTPFFTHPTQEQVQKLWNLAISAMKQVGLDRDDEYLDSVFCVQNLPPNHGERRSIMGFDDLAAYVYSEMEHGARRFRGKWEDDSLGLSVQIEEWAGRF